MSQAPTLSEVIALASQLPAKEQRLLVDSLLSGLAVPLLPPRPGRKWSDVRGTAQHPVCGEDAQQWVSRIRAEWDEHRERLLRDDE
jgi:hypothetical protein